MDIEKRVSSLGLDFETIKQNIYYQSSDLLEKVDRTESFEIMLELREAQTELDKVKIGIQIFRSDKKYLPELLKLNNVAILDFVNLEDDLYSPKREAFLRIAVVKDVDKEECIFDLLSENLEHKRFKPAEINLVKDYLFGTIVEKEVKKFQKLCVKLAKYHILKSKRDSDPFMISLNEWVAYNESYLTQPFYERLRIFLADQSPLAFTESQFNKYRNDQQVANNDVVVAKELYDELGIPGFTYLVYLAHYASHYYEALLQGDVTTSFTIFDKALRRLVKDNFSLLKQVMEVLGVTAQISLIQLLFDEEQEKTVEYLLTFFITKSAKKCGSKTRYLLNEAYQSTKNKSDLKGSLNALLDHKKKHVQHLANELLGEWD